MALDIDVDNNGATDIEFGGTNAKTAADARTNLGLEIGVDVLAPDGDGSGVSGVYVMEHYFADASQSDQGVISGSANTIAYLAQTIGTSGNAYIILSHDPTAGNTTTYTFDTSFDLTTYPGIFFIIEPGVRLARTTGDEIVTFYSPKNIIAAPDQQITSAQMINFAYPGLVYADWFGGTFSGTMPEGEAVSFDSGGAQWDVDFETPSHLNDDEVIAFAYKDSPLRLYMVEDPLDGGVRVYLWDNSTTLPMIPHTSVRPTFAVYGDILVGDIVALGSNPMTYFVRANTGLAATATTQFFSAQNGSNDTNGGSQIVMAPVENGGGVINDGYIDLVAYGIGTGALANSIMFGTRESSGPVTRRWMVSGQSPTKGDLLPYVDNTYDLGSTGARVKDIHTVRIIMGTNITWSSGSGTPEGAVTAAVGSIFSRTDGGANTTFYVKESGSGNTGWVAK